MKKVEIYTSRRCNFCTMAKQLLDSKGIPYSEIMVDQDMAKRQEMMVRSKQRTVPQIFIQDRAIGGYSDLLALEKKKQLDGLLA